MPWIQLHIAAAADQVNALEDALQLHGAEAVTLMDAQDQPIFEPPLGTTPVWDHTIVTGLFQAETDCDSLIADLQAALPFPLPTHRIERLEDQVWERSWMEHFEPMQFGDRLWICPSWHTPPQPDAVNLMLDPGVAFGTGTHETTSLCLQWLDQHPLEQQQVIDFGCGSGVLGIAALLLGAEQVIATDIDPQALDASRRNAEHNHVGQRLHLYLPQDMPASVQADLVLANILAAPLIELAPTLAGYCKPGGHLVLSGILAEQQHAVLQAYAPYFELAPVTQLNDWVRISGQRKAD